MLTRHRSGVRAHARCRSLYQKLFVPIVPRFSHLVGLRPRLKTTHLQFFFFNQKIKNRPKLLKNRDVQEPVKRLKKLLRPLVAIKRVEEALKGKEERGWRSWYGLWWKLKKGGLQWLIRHKEEGSEKPWHLIPFVYFSFLKNTNLLVSKIVLSIILKKKRLYQKKYPLCKVLIDLDVFLSILFLNLHFIFKHFVSIEKIKIFNFSGIWNIPISKRCQQLWF